MEEEMQWRRSAVRRRGRREGEEEGRSWDMTQSYSQAGEEGKGRRGEERRRREEGSGRQGCVSSRYRAWSLSSELGGWESEEGSEGEGSDGEGSEGKGSDSEKEVGGRSEGEVGGRTLCEGSEENNVPAGPSGWPFLPAPLALLLFPLLFLLLFSPFNLLLLVLLSLLLWATGGVTYTVLSQLKLNLTNGIGIKIGIGIKTEP